MVRNILTEDELREIMLQDREQAEAILLLAGPDNFEGDYKHWMHRIQEG